MPCQQVCVRSRIGTCSNLLIVICPVKIMSGTISLTQMNIPIIFFSLVFNNRIVYFFFIFIFWQISSPQMTEL